MFIINFHFQTPTSEREWLDVAESFERWNFPHCLGALDGKHVVMNAPPNSGSIYYNYKHTHSIVLMAMCNGKLELIYVDAGCNGRISDGGVFNNSSLAAALDNGSLHIPEPEPLPGMDTDTPHVIVADDAFALKENIIKPYSARNLSPSQRILNYRVSRARRCIENVFGIMSARFRVLRSPISLDAAKTRKVTLACCVLHNYLMNDARYAPAGFADQIAADGSITDGAWRQEIPDRSMYPLENLANRYTSIPAARVREDFEAYFMSVDGEVPWQYQHI